ncbi:MAG: Asp23/Gls24 family envelope stress response protein [Clostridia bacterium]|nr:Asp23/Gls24 family envelope stress response protein [Clostridia bacterium]
MGENLPLSVQLDDNPNGTVTFASDVVATMAGLAATEVEGVFSMYAGSSSFSDIFSRRSQGSKNNHTKGVKVDVVDDKVSVDVSIVVDYGTPVPTIAREIQENVKKAVETMSGLEVSHVDVHIQGVSFEKENKAQQELLEQQKAAMLAASRAEEPAPEPEAKPEPEEEEAPETPAVPHEDDEADDDDDYELVLEDVPEEEDSEERPEE